MDRTFASVVVVLAVLLGPAMLINASPIGVLDGSQNVHASPAPVLALVGGVTIPGVDYTREYVVPRDGRKIAWYEIQYLLANAVGGAPYGLALGGSTLSSVPSPATTAVVGKSIYLDLDGGDLTGNSGVVGITTYRDLGSTAVSSNNRPGNISIQNVGDIDMGIIRTGRRSTNSGFAGDAVHSHSNITIGSSSVRAGNIRVDGLYTADTELANAKSSSGRLIIHSDGNVIVKTAIPGETPVLGDIIMWVRNGDWENGQVGELAIRHVGSFEANNIYACRGDGISNRGGTPYQKLFDGNAYGVPGNPVGNFRVAGHMRFDSNIVSTSGDAGIANGHATITGYRNIEIGGNIWTYNLVQVNTRHAGDFTATATETIKISGGIDMRTGHASATKGTLTLNAGQSIMLSQLDLGLMKEAVLNAPQSFIRTLAESGFAASKIRANTGQYVIYDAFVNTFMDYATSSLTGGGLLVPGINAQSVYDYVLGSTAISADLYGSGGKVNIMVPAGFSGSAMQSWTIVQGVNGQNFGNGLGNPFSTILGDDALALNGVWSTSLSGNNVMLTFTPVPEPATLTFLGLGGLAMAGAAARRRRRA